MSATGTGLPRQVEIYCVLAGSWQLPGWAMGTLFWEPLPGALPCKRGVLPLEGSGPSPEDVPGPKACSPCLETRS